MSDWWVEAANDAGVDQDWLKVKSKEMALGVNGGDWDVDYTEVQRRGWAIKVLWVCDKYPEGIF